MIDFAGRVALVTGVHGQDGGYLAARLLDAGAEVHGLVRQADQVEAMRSAMPALHVHVVDLRDDAGMRDLVGDVAPDTVFNLAGSTSVARSWEQPVETADVLAVAPVRLLDACWTLDRSRDRQTLFLQASSAEIFGDPATEPQDESTPIEPVTPYGAAKAYAHQMVAVYRRRGMHASSAVLYNHESPRRPATFVARKVTRRVAEIALGRETTLTLGNMDAKRDWGYAPDYVDAMMRIVGHDVPGDYVVATGEARTVREFVAAAFAHVGIADWEGHVVVDPALYRPADPRALVGDPARLRAIGWAPSVTFDQLVSLMVEADLEDLRSA